jgi:hypothetical protein
MVTNILQKNWVSMALFFTDDALNMKGKQLSKTELVEFFLAGNDILLFLKMYRWQLNF